MNISHCLARFGGSADPLGDGYTNAASPPIFSVEVAAATSARSTLLNFGGVAHFSRSVIPGGVVEWFMAPVLKTGRPRGLVGSNPTPSALRQVISER